VPSNSACCEFRLTIAASIMVGWPVVSREDAGRFELRPVEEEDDGLLAMGVEEPRSVCCVPCGVADDG
jgi:hypothetical protein